MAEQAARRRRGAGPVLASFLTMLMVIDSEFQGSRLLLAELYD
jgi:hypothetical protein